MQEGPYDQAFDEIELLGFPLCSPFDLLQATPLGLTLAREMIGRAGSTVQMLGYYVARKHVTTVRKEHMNFGTWLDREGLFFDSTTSRRLWPGTLSRQGHLPDDGKDRAGFRFSHARGGRDGEAAMVKDERY